jgi:hypothetical protein
MSRTTLLLCILGLTVCAYLVMAPIQLKVATLEETVQNMDTPREPKVRRYVVRIPVGTFSDLNEFLASHPECSFRNT